MGCSWLPPTHLHSQSHLNHPGSPTFPPGTPRFSLDKPSPSAVLKVIFSSASLNSKEKLEKAALGAIFRPWICLSDRVGVREWQGERGSRRMGAALEFRQEPLEAGFRSRKKHLELPDTPVHPRSSQFKVSSEPSELSNSLIQRCCPKFPGQQDLGMFLLDLPMPRAVFRFHQIPSNSFPRFLHLYLQFPFPRFSILIKWILFFIIKRKKPSHDKTFTSHQKPLKKYQNRTKKPPPNTPK